LHIAILVTSKYILFFIHSTGIDRKDKKHLGLVFVDSMKLVKFSNHITLGLEQVILTLIDVDCWFHFLFSIFGEIFCFGRLPSLFELMNTGRPSPLLISLRHIPTHSLTFHIHTHTNYNVKAESSANFWSFSTTNYWFGWN